MHVEVVGIMQKIMLPSHRLTLVARDIQIQGLHLPENNSLTGTGPGLSALNH